MPPPASSRLASMLFKLGMPRAKRVRHGTRACGPGCSGRPAHGHTRSGA
jgi:hypothetical protein